ncbi:hypothetical protein GGX14DRAFT_585136 [Mycena pura]|uniref:Nucleoporin Nup159/Nup146 N-terminal domain-containing protein n=1 Tax=Mycena pura TaxID=153505 RepID=A0AAD6VQI1_9AGAR|nr:hypothetical protein GGX14DRAFT_585136 [Mycena pura]
MAFAPLSRPDQSQVKLDATPNRPQSDGFNYPTFRLLNKQSRVILSPETLVPSSVRRVFTTTSANGLIISPLSNLRDAFRNGSNDVFTPNRTLPCNAVAIAFACNGTRLLAGTAQGQILVYDTAGLFSSSAQVDPFQVYQASSSPLLQILPNPSNESELAQLVATVRADGTVQMLDMQMETKGAWTGSDEQSTPVAASWSPKGKQLAIGLRSGDILTFGLSNNASPLKHIPGTANAPLMSLHWLGPAFTFRTSYASNSGDPPHHIVSFDARSNTAAFIQLTHPFPLPARPQNSQVLVLPRWDQDSAAPSAEETKALVVVGDTSSTDLEVLGNAGLRWFQQSQENQLTIPLDKNDEDTFLLTLDMDMTDELPIMYAYLNDGTVQGWYITHPDSKPYAGLVGAPQVSPSAPAFGLQQPTTTPALGQQSTSTFGQSSAFGQSSPSPFGQPQSTPVFGQSALGQKSVFNQSSFGIQPSTPSPFGSSSTSSAFGSSATGVFGSGGGFGTFASSSGAFGVASTPASAPPMSTTPSVSMGEEDTPSFSGLSLGSSTSVESDNKPIATGGGIFGSSPSPLPLPPDHPANQLSKPSPSTFTDPSLIKPAAGFGAFGAITSGAFGNTKHENAFSGGTSRSAFGGGSNESVSPAVQNSTASPAFGKSGFGQTGFGFGQTAFPQKPTSTFGQTGFGASGATGATTAPTGGAFSAFASGGPTAFTSAATTVPSTGGFGMFTSVTPSAFGKPATPSVFGGGGSGDKGTSVFGGGAPSTTPASPAIGSDFGSGNGGGSGAPSLASSSVFGQTGASAASSTPATAFAGFAPPSGSLFGNKAQQSDTTQESSAKSKGESTSATAFAGFGTPSASLFGNQPSTPTQESDSMRDRRSPSPNDNSPPAPVTTSSPPNDGAFGKLKSASSGFKPATGFGAFSSGTTPTSSPFFNAAAQAKPVAVSAFANSGSGSPATPLPVAGKPAFGSTSVLGGAKSAFAPISTTPTTPSQTSTVASAFNAFSGTPVSFGSPSTPGKSFGELLKIGDEKPKAGGIGAESSKHESPFPSAIASPPLASTSVAPTKRAPVFTPPPKDTDSAPSEDTPKGSKGKTSDSPPTDNEKEATASGESSFGSLSLNSRTSSFVEVSGGEAEDADGEGDEESAVDDEPGDDDFLSESFGSGSEAPSDGEDGEDDYSRSPSPSAIPLPPSRSPSSTPHAEAPKISVSSTPTISEDEESDSSETSRLSTIREESATPPGSPEKKERSPPQTQAQSPTRTPLAAPVPVVASPFGIGLGRPSTRPTRSSPLASAPVSGDDDKKSPEVEKSVFKARPASPKPPFGALPAKAEDKRTPKPARPKTPPLSALSFTPPPSKPQTVEKIPLAGATLPSFPGIGVASAVTPRPSPSNTAVSVPATPGNFFGISTQKATMSPAASTSVSALKPLLKVPPIASSSTHAPVAPSLDTTMEEGLQKECALLFANITRELADFRALAQAANQRRTELSKSLGGSRRVADLGIRAKWALPDAVQFGQTMRLYEQELEDLKEKRAQWEKLIRELQSNLLKAGTRREEIGRFLKAQHDKDFAKMLKARTLGPEHLETQTHLRRNIRAIQDRIQKLESHLQESKKRLSRAKSGNPGLRAPTLDTLNRTFRNMDIALDNQTSDVEKLTARVAGLSVSHPQSNGHTAGARDARLPDPITRQRPFTVTPHVAMTTAAALNAERSAHKLKRALLAARKEPLLNTQAAAAPPAPVAFKTPHKAAVGIDIGLGALATPFNLGQPVSLPSTPLQTTMFGFDLPEDNFNPSPPPPVRRGAGGGGKSSRISGSVPLKRSPGQTSVAPPPQAFNWGPLPTFGKPKSVSPENSLGGSWVSEGFGSK